MSARHPNEPFALLSHHRSGSNFVTELLWRHPALQVLIEPLAQHLDIFITHDLQAWPQHLTTDALEALRRPFERRYLTNLGTWLRAQAGRGFKETRLAEKIEWFNTAVAPVRTIVLVRDPRAVTASILARPHMVDYWIPADHIKHLPNTFDHHRAHRDPIYRSAAIWTYRYTCLLSQAETAGAPTVVLEKLMHNPAREMSAIETYLDIDHFDYTDTLAELWTPTTAGTYSTRRDPATVATSWRAALTREDLAVIGTTCGPLMDHFGY
ncbi:MAG: hypothetical protein ACRCYU_00740 [Nocardioides sp.]